MQRVRVLVADDQALFREGLHTLLDAHGDVDVVGEASNGEEAVALAASLRPDVILMDLRMPVLDGCAATRRILGAGSTTRILVLTTFDDQESVFDALRAGAIGYLLKDVPSERLVEAVRVAARGQSSLEPAVASKVVAEFARLSRAAPRRPSVTEALSDREVEVLRWVARGASNKEIAVHLSIAEGTVKNHMTNILEKLDVSDRTSAALKARELGFA
ncbi:MAG TPA: response regulator transcription factor [Polyangiaceae bacterium]|nr:response regulator transcription factor [Polyangiaceae bacterium]